MTGRIWCCSMRGQHRLEPVAVADGDPLQADLARDDGTERGLDGQAGQHADHGQRAAGPHRAQRERQRLRAAQFDDQVIATLGGGDVPAGTRPVRGGGVVDGGVRPHGGDAGQLVIAGGDHRHMRPVQLGEGQREQGDAACALHQYPVPGTGPAMGDDRAPCGQRRAGKRRGLGIASDRREPSRRRPARGRHQSAITPSSGPPRAEAKAAGLGSPAIQFWK